MILTDWRARVAAAAELIEGRFEPHMTVTFPRAVRADIRRIIGRTACRVLTEAIIRLGVREGSARTTARRYGASCADVDGVALSIQRLP